MIDRNANIIKDPKIKRIVEYSEGDKQVNVRSQLSYQQQ